MTILHLSVAVADIDYSNGDTKTIFSERKQRVVLIDITTIISLIQNLNNPILTEKPDDNSLLKSSYLTNYKKVVERILMDDGNELIDSIFRCIEEDDKIELYDVMDIDIFELEVAKLRKTLMQHIRDIMRQLNLLMTDYTFEGWFDDNTLKFVNKQELMETIRVYRL